MSRRVEQTVVVNATPDVVWQALSEAEQLVRWFPPDARIEPGQGGSIWLSWGDGMEGTAPITAWDPPRHLQWQEDRGPVKLSVDFYVEAAGGGTTRVRLVQSGFGDGPEWDGEYHMVDGGWAYFLANLKWYLEHHPGRPRDLISLREVTGHPRADAFARLRARLDQLPGDTLVERQATQQYARTLPELNHSLVFLEIEPHPSGSRPGLWISTYGLSAERLAASREQFTRLYRESVAAPPAP